MINVHRKGFTIIELMIVLAIVAILVALALPSFQDVVRKSRRSDAMNAILNIHLAQERHRVNNVTYGTLSELGMVAAGVEKLASPDGYYVLTITNLTATTYTIAGEAQDDQTNDACKIFTLAFSAGNIIKTTTPINATCWKK